MTAPPEVAVFNPAFDVTPARWVTAIITLGEGYHNFHHRFQSDYRNGVRWFHFDPTKWLVWGFSKVGITRDLRRASPQSIQRAREAVRGQSAAA